MAAPYLLGIDIGTSSSKGVIIAADGSVKAVGLIEHGIDLPKPGWAEHDAESVWWGGFCQLLPLLTGQAKIDPSQIEGIGISAMCPDLVLIDKNGTCIRPAILYGIDSRAKQQINTLNSLFGKKKIYDLVGHDLSSQSLLPKILWLRENERENFARTHKMLTASSYVVYKLTDSFVIDYFTASAGGLLNIRTTEWVIELFEDLGLSIDLFPRLGYSSDIAGRVTASAAKRLGLKSGIPVIIGTGDVTAEAISAGVFEPGETILVYGSTMSYLQCLDRPVTHGDLFNGHYVFPSSWFIGGATATAGALTKWFRDNFAPLEKAIEKELGINAYSLLSEEAGKIQSPTGIIVLPYLGGARTPINDEKAKGVIAGLTLSHGKGDLYKAILEGIGYEIRHNFEIMEEAKMNPAKIVAVGGGTKSETWMQIVSDILQKKQYCIAQEVGAPLGAAYLAGVGVGIIPGFTYIQDNFVQIGRVVQPSDSAGRDYDKYYHIYRELYELTKDSVHRLS